MDILGIFSILFLKKNILCDPSLDASHRDGSIEGSQNTCLRISEIRKIVFELSTIPHLS